MARTQKRKECLFCRKKMIDIDYKDSTLLARYLTAWAKIRTRKDTGACAKHQRRLADAIKRARYLAILPYTTR